MSSSTLPKTQVHFTAAEIDFLAHEERVLVIPNFKDEALTFVGGSFGPFRPGIAVEVPLWLAVTLKKTQKCRILPPEWLTVDNFEKVLHEEKIQKEGVTPFHYHYMEITTSLLVNAADDLQQPEQLQSLLEDIWNIRSSKFMEGLKKANPDPQRLRNISAMELNLVRGPVQLVMNQMVRLADNAVAEE